MNTTTTRRTPLNKLKMFELVALYNEFRVAAGLEPRGIWGTSRDTVIGMINRAQFGGFSDRT